MKKYHYFFPLLCTLYTQWIYAQTNEVKTAVSYSCVFNVKFDRGHEYQRFNASLWIHNLKSGFFMLPDVSVEKKVDHAMEIVLDVDTIFRVYKDFEKECLLFGDIVFDGKENFYRDTLHIMQWELGDEKKMIDSFTCLNATTFFKGRYYTAWYCPAIPIPNGPWKLGGLPGLILEAYDEHKDIHFILNRIEHIKKLNQRVFDGLEKYPSYETYVRYWKDFFEKVNGAAKAQDNPDCISCLTNSTLKAYTWEKISLK
jgi:GLPGLI family protein